MSGLARPATKKIATKTWQKKSALGRIAPLIRCDRRGDLSLPVVGKTHGRK